MTAFDGLQNNRMEAGTHPVQKIHLMVVGNDTEVFVKLLLADNGGRGGGGRGGGDNNQFTDVAGGVGRGTMERRSKIMGTQELQYMNSLLIHLREDNKAMRDVMAIYHEREKRMLKMLNANLKTLMRHPALMHGIHVPA